MDTMRHVVTALDAADVADIVRDAGRAGFRIAGQQTPYSRAFGHERHEAAFPTLFLDTAHLTDFTICPSSRTARIGAGVTTAHLTSTAASHGLLAIPGRSPHTPAVTTVLTGGLGRTARAHGLASDHAVAFDVVDADGNRLRASAHENEDLFWALSGGGVDFAVVTAMEVRLHDIAVPKPTTRTMAWPFAAAADVLAVFRDITATAPEHLMLQVTLSHSEVLISSTFLGTPSAARVLLQPFETIPGARNWPREVWAPTASPAEMLSDLDDSALSALLAHPLGPYHAVHIQHLGGRLARHSTKGPHGTITEQYLLTITTTGPGPAATHPAGLIDALGTSLTGRKTLDLLTSDESPAQAFGAEELILLDEIKAAWDPTGLFVGHRGLAGVG